MQEHAASNYTRNRVAGLSLNDNHLPTASPRRDRRKQTDNARNQLLGLLSRFGHTLGTRTPGKARDNCGRNREIFLINTGPVEERLSCISVEISIRKLFFHFPSADMIQNKTNELRDSRFDRR